MPKKNLQLLLYGIVLAIFALGIIWQTHVLFNQDTSWQMHIAERWLAGGNYYDNFFEINPPMAMYIYLPALLLNSLTHWGLLVCARIYIFVLAMGAWWLYSFLLQHFNIFANRINYFVFLIVMAAVFNFLPGGSFAEREYIATLLILPYLLTLTAYCVNYPLGKGMRLLTSVMAAIAFVIKPHFLLVWLLLEIYVAVYKKSCAVLWRRENILIGSFVVIYVGTVFLFFPDFVFEVVPLLAPLYRKVHHISPLVIMFQAVAIYCYFISFLYLALRKHIASVVFPDLLLIVSTAFFIVDIYQQSTWYYHFLPVLMLQTLLLTVLVVEYVPKFFLACRFSADFLDYWLVILLFALISILPVLVWPINSSVMLKKTKVNNQLIPFLVSQKQKTPAANSLLIFTKEIFDTYPLVDYTGWYSTSRFPSFWMLDYFVRPESLPKNIVDREQFFREKKLFVELAVDDLVKNPPRLILFFNKNPEDGREYWPVDYLTLLNEDPRFADVWQQYAFLQRVGAVEIYQRKSE